MDTSQNVAQKLKIVPKFSIIKVCNWYRNRSMSCAVPEFEEVAYELHFVPMLK